MAGGRSFFPRRFLRREKTLEIVGNHYVVDAAPYCNLEHNAGSIKCWVVRARVYSEGKAEVEQLALKF